MVKTRVYVDSGILILASRSTNDEITKRALEELEREDIEFLYSKIVQLETIPAPSRNPQYAHQLEMLNYFFSNSQIISCDDAAQNIAIEQASCGFGLGTGDALHVGAALSASVDYILTAEAPTSQMMKCKAVQFRTIYV